MALYLISYDLDKPGQDYPDLIARLKEFGAQRVLYSEWFLIHSATPVQLRDDLMRFMDANDRILVVELKNYAAWQRLMIDGNTVKAFFNNAT
ncbi:MAG: SinR family protein [Acidobacteriia bacterium]|nr:SinR family protein [Terriglobia bacterium]